MANEKNKAEDVVAAIKAATTVAAVNELIEDDTRKTVQEAATAQIAALEAPEETNTDDADEKALAAAKAVKAHKKFLADQKGYEFKGKLYVFKDHTPSTLSFQGKAVSLVELLKDKKAMDALVGGGSGFIKRK